MTRTLPAASHRFLMGGGEMGKLTREKDWSRTPVGAIDTWPQSLKTTLSILLNSKFPMFLFWGPSLICFYNDAYRPSLGKKGKHPGILGMAGEKAWPEVWPVIKPLIDQVLAGGDATWSEDQLLPIYRNDNMEDVYWTFSYSAVDDESGHIAGVFVTCTETTSKLNSLKKIETSEKNFRNLVYESPVAAAVFRGKNFIIELVNDASLQLWGKGRDIIGKTVAAIFPEPEALLYLSILKQVYETGIAYEGRENPITLLRDGNTETIYVNFIYKALKNEEGVIDGVLSMGYDVTEQVNARNQLKELEERTRLAIDVNEIGFYEADLRTGNVEFSEKMHQIYGSAAPLPPEAYVSMIHPDDLELRKKAHEEALQTGKLEYQYRIVLKNGNVRWIDSHAKICYNDDGQPVKRIGTIQDITARKILVETAEAAEKKFRNTVMQAPVGIVLMKGPAFVVEMVNEAYLQLVDKKEDAFVGKPLFDTLPEVRAVIEPLLNKVMTTGVPYHANELEVILNRFGKKEPAFFNLEYQPLRESDGTISGVMAVANEVTAQVADKFALRENEEKFSNLVMQSPIAMTIWRGRDYIIEIANETLLKNIWRKEAHEVIGKKALEVFPELYDQKYPALLEKVFTEGIVCRENEAVAWVQGNDGMKKFYLDFEYSPLFEKDHSISGIMITVNDVTQRVAVRQQLEDAEERMRLAAEATGLATWDLNLQTRQIIYSPRLAAIFGYPETAVITHQAMRQLIHPEDLKNIVVPAFKYALTSGVYLYEARIIHPNKAIHWIRTHGKVFFDENKMPVRMLGTMRDITEQKENEENTRRLAAIVQSSEDAIISKRIDGTVTSWNDAARRMFKYTAEEMIGNSILKLMPEDKITEEYEIIDRLKKGQRIEHFETRRMAKDKKQLHISLSISPLKDAMGNVIGASKIIRDITRQKEAERLINESEQKFRLLADSMPQFIWTSDPKGNLNYFSRTVYDFSGLSAAQINRDGWLQIVHPDDREGNMKQWMHAIETGEPFLFEHRFRRHDGEYRWQLSRAIPQKNETGNIQMWVGTSTDIDEIKKHDQQKDDFIKVASHELKTPVTTIKGYVQLLMKMNSSGQDNFLTKSLATIDRQIYKLTKLITDLLDLTKIETGSLQLNKEEFYIAGVVREIAEELETTSQTHSITVHEHANPVIYADRDRISQVFINLFTNAIKYSPAANNIIVEISLLEDNVLISVKDFGIGISQEDSLRIFERFYRAAGKDEKTFPGFGIGLFIVNEIIGLHHGKIWLHSEKNKGSVFYVSLPLNN